MDKGAMYQLMNQQLEGLLKATPYRISGLANASALLWETLGDINWAGFYSHRRWKADSGTISREGCLYRD
jgi:GAF domain-containing protein